MNRTHYSLLTLAAVLGLAASAQGTTIAIANAGFESPALASGGSAFDTAASLVTSWNFTGHASGQGANIHNNGNVYGGGTFSLGIAGPNSGDHYAGLHVGEAAPTGSASYDQTTGTQWSSLTVGDTLTFSVYTNYRNDSPLVEPGLTTLSLNGGGGTISQVLNVAGDTQGVWTLHTLTHVVTAADVASSAFINVEIGMVYDGGTAASQTFLDDASLELTAIPEPSIALLGGLGLLGLLRRRR